MMTDLKFEEKDILINGINVSYIDEGEADDTVIIFIHGFPFDKWTWENQISLLKEQYRVIAYDVRGHGHSIADTSQMSVSQLADDLFSLMDALVIDSAIVCGLSMGGYIALNAILADPARIKALVLCDTQCAADSDQVRKRRMDTIAVIQKKGLALYTKDSIQKLFCGNSLVQLKPEVSLIRQTILRTPVTTIVNTLKALADRKETCSELNRIDVPVMILVGESDQITSPVVAQKMSALITGSVLHVIERAGHLSNLENSNTFNIHMRKFLATIEQTTKPL